MMEHTPHFPPVRPQIITVKEGGCSNSLTVPLTSEESKGDVPAHTSKHEYFSVTYIFLGLCFELIALLETCDVIIEAGNSSSRPYYECDTPIGNGRFETEQIVRF